MNRELSRRLSRLEGVTLAERVRFIVSDRPLGEDEWLGDLSGCYSNADDATLSPVMSEAEWIAAFTRD